MSALYKRFVRVLEKWPIEKSKTGRDLGEHLREHVKLIFGSNSPVIFEGNQLEREIDALDRLTKNIYQSQYPRKLTSTATGLTAEQCNQVLSSEFLEYLNDEKNLAHVPVLANEAIEYLNLNSDKTFIDMTFGAGGHSKLILDKYPGIKILALDRDPVAYEYAQKLAAEYPSGQVTPILGRFSELPQQLKELEIAPNSIDGMLFDFGCSSMQFDEAERGFSLSKNGPLDMRMDKERHKNMPTAADVLANIHEQDLYRVLKIYGEEKNAKKIAHVIVTTRYSYRRIETTRELAELIRSCFNEGEHRQDKLQRHAHVATKTFQALRIFVNNEVNEINYGLTIAPKLLKTDGVLAAISFHSLEDTIVKRHITGNVINNSANPVPLKYTSHTLMHDEKLIESLKKSHWKQIHKHVITPSAEEIEHNPRSRSAKLRAAIKIT